MSSDTPQSSPDQGAAPKDAAPVKDQESLQEWERGVLEKLAFASLKEQRRARRWNIVLRIAFLVYLVALPLIYFPPDVGGLAEPERHTALVEVSGVIGADKNASADRIVGGLRAAFEDQGTAAVILRINSPGGSPVQSGYINDEVHRLRKAHPNTPMFAVIADVAASGGYYVAVAADRIYADKASIVGSIGVLMNGFGFVDTMDMLGVERRLLTAGENKALMDPFSPVRASDEAHTRALLDRIHQQFIEVVKKGRGDRLADDPELFSGLIWSGEESVTLGLVDGLGSSSYVARELVGEARIKNFTPSEGLLTRLTDRLGASIATHLGSLAGGWQLR